MPTRFWRYPARKIRKCSEKRVEVCDTAATDDCCEVIACGYCLIWRVEGEPDVTGYAPFSTDRWSGGVGPISFVGFWERAYGTGECEFVVLANDIEVYRKSCYEGQSCRDSSDSAVVAIEYLGGTLIWSKDLKRPLPIRFEDAYQDPYNWTGGCKKRWCGTCDCTCKCLCITVTPSVVTSEGGYYAIRSGTGTLCDSAYECDGPLWIGEVGTVPLEISLERDEYTEECFLEILADGELFQVEIEDCTDINLSVTLTDGTKVTIKCALCETCTRDTCCPPGSCFPIIYLTMSTGGMCSCWDGVSIPLYQRSDCSQTWNTVNYQLLTCDDHVLQPISITVTCVEQTNGVVAWLMTITTFSRCTAVGQTLPEGGCSGPSPCCIDENGSCPPPSANFCFTVSGLDCCAVGNPGTTICFTLSL